MEPYRSPLRSDATAGRVALISGGGTGIGRATALELAGSGAGVAICGRREERLEAVREEVAAGGGECLAVTGDIREPDDVERIVGATLERFGGIDVLVNNAGGQFSAPAEDITAKGWRAVHRLTVDATWHMTRAVATRTMIPARRGLVVFLGFSPMRGIAGFAHASAARAALGNLAAGLSAEWSRYGIRSVYVAAGTIETEGLDQYGPEALEAWRRSIPLGRTGRPQEVASLIAFLASAGGAFITGTTIAIDGGQDAWGAAAPPPPPEAR